MPLFKGPDGTVYELPEQATPEIHAFIQENKLVPEGPPPSAKPPPSPLIDSLKSLISGGVEGLARAPLIGADIAKLGMHGINKILPGMISPEIMDRTGSQPWIDAFRGSPDDERMKGAGLDLSYEPQTQAGRLTKAGSSAVAGGVAMGGLGALPGIAKSAMGGLNAAKVAMTPGSVAINASAGVGGQVAQEVTDNPLIALLTSLGIVGGGNAIRSIRAPNINQTIFDATKDLKPKNWSEAEKQIGDFEAAGSKTFTLADLPELQPRLGGTAKGLSNTTGGNLLQSKLGDARVNQDIPNILGSMKDDISAPFDPRTLATDLSGGAQAKINALKNQRSEQRTANLSGSPEIPPIDLVDSMGPLFKAIGNPENQSTGSQKAMKSAIDALLGKGASKEDFPMAVPPITGNVTSLSQNVKNLRKPPMGDPRNPAAGVSSYQQMQAADLAEEALRDASGRASSRAGTTTDFSKAMKDYADFTATNIDPVKRSLTGGMAGVTEPEGVLSQVRKVPFSKIAPEVADLTSKEANKRAIARTLAEQVKPMPNLTGASNTAVNDRALLTPLLESIDPALAGGVANKIKTADQLSKTIAESGVDSTMNRKHGQNFFSRIVSPFGSASNTATLRSTEKETVKLAELLGNPTPENLAKLEKLAKIDPRAQRALQWISSLTGAAQNSSTKPQPIRIELNNMHPNQPD